MKLTLEQKQETDIQEQIRVRTLEVVNSEDQVIARIGEEHSDADEKVKDNKIARFFNTDGNQIAAVGFTSEGGTLEVLGDDGTAALRCGWHGGRIDLMSTNTTRPDNTDNKMAIRPSWDGYEIELRDHQGNLITVELNIDEGKVEIVSTYEHKPEQKEIRTSQIIFKSAE